MEGAFQETDISRAILDAYHAKLREAVDSEVVIVGAGPSGLVAAWRLAGAGHRTTVLEKRLSPGGGIWGGSMGMNEIVVQDESLGLLEQVGVRHRAHGGLHTADAMELAAALTLKALQAGARLFNLTEAEDLCVHGGRVVGVVANRTLLAGNLPIDPLVLAARAVIDATGHEAVLAQCLRKRGLLSEPALPGEGPLDAPAGERFVVDHVAELYPGLWTTGMSVCTTFGGPRMGPIFGGMLRSGVRVAELVMQTLGGK